MTPIVAANAAFYSANLAARREGQIQKAKLGAPTKAPPGYINVN